MGVHKSAKQVLEKHTHDMDTELGALYNALMKEVTWVHAEWGQYQQLFSSPEQIDLLNEVAGHFFGFIQNLLLEDVILHLARLTDPPQSMGKDNLTLKRLPTLISNTQLKTEVQSLVTATVTACNAAREWRNRRLAHRDLALTLAKETIPLPGINSTDITAALAAMEAVLNRLNDHYLGSKIAYALTITDGVGANSLVYYLSKGVQTEKQPKA